MSHKNEAILLLVAVLITAVGLVLAGVPAFAQEVQEGDWNLKLSVVDPQGSPIKVYYIIESTRGWQARREGFTDSSGQALLSLQPDEYRLQLAIDRYRYKGKWLLDEERTVPDHILIEEGKKVEKTVTYDKDAPDERQFVGLPSQSRFGKKIDKILGWLWVATYVLVLVGPSLPFVKRKHREFQSLPKEEQRRKSIPATRRLSYRLIVLGVIGTALGWLIGSPLLTLFAFAGCLLIGLLLQTSASRYTKKGPAGAPSPQGVAGPEASPEIVSERRRDLSEVATEYQTMQKLIVLGTILIMGSPFLMLILFAVGLGGVAGVGLLGLFLGFVLFFIGGNRKRHFETDMNMRLIRIRCPVCSKEVYPKIKNPHSLRKGFLLPGFFFVNSLTREIAGEDCGHTLVPSVWKSRQVWTTVVAIYVLIFLIFGTVLFLGSRE